MLKIGCFPQDTKKTENCRHEIKKKERKKKLWKKEREENLHNNSNNIPINLFEINPKTLNQNPHNSNNIQNPHKPI